MTNLREKIEEHLRANGWTYRERRERSGGVIETAGWFRDDATWSSSLEHAVRNQIKREEANP